MKTEKTGINEFRKRSLHKKNSILIGILICLISFIADIMTGSSMLSVSEVLSAIFNTGNVSPTTNVIVWTLRLPSATMALVVGACLGIAGACMQTLLDNPLASPYTLGVSAGSGFGASLILVTGIGTATFLGSIMVPIGAFCGAMLVSGTIFLISRLRGFSTSILVLSGIGLMFFFQALQSVLQYSASAETLQSIVFWTMGNLTKANWKNIAVVSLSLFVCAPLILLDSWKLTALKLGDTKAKSLGIKVDRLRVKMLVIISVLSAFAVSFVGTIGFVGIVGPHIARMLVGEDQRYFISLSAICGAAMLSLASFISKLVVPGALLPVSIVTSIIGVPFFFIIMFSRNKRGVLS